MLYVRKASKTELANVENKIGTYLTVDGVKYGGLARPLMTFEDGTVDSIVTSSESRVYIRCSDVVLVISANSSSIWSSVIRYDSTTKRMTKSVNNILVSGETNLRFTYASLYKISDDEKLFRVYSDSANKMILILIKMSNHSATLFANVNTNYYAGSFVGYHSNTAWFMATYSGYLYVYTIAKGSTSHSVIFSNQSSVFNIAQLTCTSTIYKNNNSLNIFTVTGKSTYTTVSVTAFDGSFDSINSLAIGTQYSVFSKGIGSKYYFYCFSESTKAVSILSNFSGNMSDGILLGWYNSQIAYIYSSPMIWIVNAQASEVTSGKSIPGIDDSFRSFPGETILFSSKIGIIGDISLNKIYVLGVSGKNIISLYWKYSSSIEAYKNASINIVRYMASSPSFFGFSPLSLGNLLLNYSYSNTIYIYDSGIGIENFPDIVSIVNYKSI